MSASEVFRDVSAEDLEAFRRVCTAIKASAAAQQTKDIPDDIVPLMLTAGTQAFRSIVQDEKRPLDVFEKNVEMTPTAVVVTVSAMLRAVELNSFDLAMWFTGAPASPSPS
jgi:hypothetical protein